MSDEILVAVGFTPLVLPSLVSVYVNTLRSSHVKATDGEIAEKVKELFDLRPKAIEKTLKLRQPMYLETAAYGHMGRKNEVVKKNFREPLP